jgi:hypothetical protein
MFCWKYRYQVRKCTEYAERNGNGIVIANEHVYSDEGLSGVGMDRPSLQRLLCAALAPVRSFGVILVDDTSRLSRSTESVLSIYRKLNFAGVQLIAVSRNIDSLHDQAERLITIRGLIDSSYVRELARRPTVAVSRPCFADCMLAEAASVTWLCPRATADRSVSPSMRLKRLLCGGSSRCLQRAIP